MKKCSYCGKVYADTATVCEVDQNPLWQIDPPKLPGTLPPLPPANAREILDNEHIKLLAIFHYVFGGFAALGLLVMLEEIVFMSAIFSGAIPTNSPKGRSGPPPEVFMAFFGGMLLIMSAIFIAGIVCNILSANFMRKRKHRKFSFAVACVNCLQIPFGTALGVFTLVVLSRASVKAQYPGD